MMSTEDSYYQSIKDTLNERLSRDSSFHAWNASIRKTKSLQTLFSGHDEMGLDPYQLREVEEKSYAITVFTRSNSGNSMGQSSVRLDPYAPLANQIDQAIRNAINVKNPVWDLPTPPKEGYIEIVSHDEKIEQDLHGSRDRLIAEAVRGVLDLTGVQVNSAELYVNFHEKVTETSSGIRMPSKNTDIYFEAAMEKLPGPNTQEVHKYKTGLSISEMDIPGFLKEMELETKTLDETNLPETSENTVIIVDNEVIASLIHAIIGQLDAEAEYNKGPHLLPDMPISEGNNTPDSDPLNLQLDPTLPVMSLSSPWNEEGLPASGGILIERGIVRNQIIGNRMGQYLNKTPNGFHGNYIMQTGSITRDDMIASQDTCIEILGFSSLLINPRTLTWSSEIKLGRLFKNGVFKSMIKGGVASGSIRDNFIAARFSSEKVSRNQVADSWHPAIGYVGPSHMLIRSGVKIAGS